MLIYFIAALLALGWCSWQQEHWDRETFFFVVGVGVLWPVALVWDVILWWKDEL